MTADTIADGQLPSDLFEAGRYRDVRRPVQEASTLPPAAYHHPAFYRRECERIFHRGWNFVGHAGRVPEPGDYAAFDFAGVPVLLVRGADNMVRAFANSCRHRGAQLADNQGHCRRLVCPYHGWTYDLDGRLVGARGMEGARGFDPADYGLVSLRLEGLGPFLWLSFDANAPPLVRWLGDLPEKLAPYSLDDLVLVRSSDYSVACNWKVYVENFMDYYHTPTVHRNTLARGNLSAYHRDPPTVERGDGEYMILHAVHAGSAALLPGAEGFPPLPALSGRAAQGSYFVCAYPCALFGCTRDCVWYVEIHPAGPAAIRIAVGACFHRDTAARPDFAERVKPYYQRWDLTVAEDNRVNELQQRGVSSPLARAGRVSPMEALSHSFRNWLLDALGI